MQVTGGLAHPNAQPQMGSQPYAVRGRDGHQPPVTTSPKPSTGAKRSSSALRAQSAQPRAGRTDGRTRTVTPQPPEARDAHPQHSPQCLSGSALPHRGAHGRPAAADPKVKPRFLRTALPGKHVVRAALPGSTPGAARAARRCPAAFPRTGAPSAPAAMLRGVALRAPAPPASADGAVQTGGFPSASQSGGGMLQQSCSKAAKSHSSAPTVLSGSWLSPVLLRPRSKLQLAKGGGSFSTLVWGRMRRMSPSAFADVIITTPLCLAL